MLSDCPLPQDEARILKAKRRAGIPVNKQKGRRRPRKWRLPEDGENNKRVIDGKPYTFDPNRGPSGR